MEPFELAPLVPQVHFHVSALACSGESVFLGTVDGQVFRYDLSASGFQSNFLAVRQRKDLPAGKHPVTKLQVLGANGRVLALCDNKLQVLRMDTLDTILYPDSRHFPEWLSCSTFQQQDYTLMSLGLARETEKTGGSSMAAAMSTVMQSEEGGPKLAVASKKKIFIYQPVTNDLIYEVTNEIVIEDPALDIMWLPSSLLTFKNKKGTFILSSTSRVKSLVTFPGCLSSAPLSVKKCLSTASSSPDTMSTGSMIFADEKAIYVHGGKAYFVSFSSESKTKQKMSITEAATGVAPNAAVFVKLAVSYGNNIDAEDIPQVKWPKQPHALAYAFPYIVAVLSDSIYVYRAKTMELVQTINTEGKGTYPIIGVSPDGKHCAMASAYTEKNPACPAFISELRMMSFDKQMKKLLDGGKNAEAISLFETVHKADVGKASYTSGLLRLMCQIAYKLMCKREFTEAFNYFSKSNVDPRVPLRFFPEVCPKYILDNPVFKIERETVYNARASMLIGSSRGRTAQSSRDMDDIESIIMSMFGGMKDSPFAITALSNAYDALYFYLQGQKRRLDQKIPENLVCSEGNVRADVISASIRLIAIQNKGLYEANALIEGNAILLNTEELEPVLTKYHCFGIIASIYAAQNQNEKALQILHDVQSQKVIDKTVNPVTTAIEIIVKEMNQDIVFKHAPWIVNADPNSALQIFCDDKRKWDFDTVYRFLEGVNSVASRKYLEQNAFNGKVTDQSILAHLAELFMQEIIQKSVALQMRGVDVIAHPELMRDAKKGDAELQKATDGLRRLLRTLKPAEAAKKVLDVINQNKMTSVGFFQEQIDAYSILGQHEEALTLALRSKDGLDEAEKYCMNETADTSGERTIRLSSLLKVLVKTDGITRDPVTGNPSLSPRTNMFLESHSNEIDVITLVNIMPPETPLASLMPILQSSMRSAISKRRELQIARGFERTINLECNYVASTASRRGFYIDSMTRCSCCDKLIGECGAFVRIPQPRPFVVCYTCFQKSEKQKEEEKRNIK